MRKIEHHAAFSYPVQIPREDPWWARKPTPLDGPAFRTTLGKPRARRPVLAIGYNNGDSLHIDGKQFGRLYTRGAVMDKFIEVMNEPQVMASVRYYQCPTLEELQDEIASRVLFVVDQYIAAVESGVPLPSAAQSKSARVYRKVTNAVQELDAFLSVSNAPGVKKEIMPIANRLLKTFSDMTSDRVEITQ